MQKLSICITSDIHGYIAPVNYRDTKEENQGLAKTAAIIKKIRAENQVVLLDNGDFIQGSPFTYYFAKYHKEQTSPLVDIANRLPYDFSVFGNHEFNYGLDYLEATVEQAEFPWLSANILNSKTNEPYFGKPYVIKEIDEQKIAFIGITTHYIPNWEDPDHIKGLVFEDACTSAKKWVSKVKEIEKPDLVVVCYHGGLERDPDNGEPTEPLTGENQGYQICQEVDGIDILITGHQHRLITTKINGVTVIQPGSKGQAVGEVSVEWNGGAVTTIDSKLHYVTDEIEADAEIIELIKNEEARVQEWLDQPITTVDGDMRIHSTFQARVKEHPFIEYINLLQMEAAGVNISCTALFHDQSPGFPAKVTMRDIVSNYIYPNTLKVLRLKGQDIKDALELSASYFTIDSNGEITVNPAFIEPKPQHYNYDMWEGITYELNISRPEGERVTKLNYQGETLELDKEFDVVMNNYRASGGGNYFMFQGKEIVKDIPIDMTELIADNLLKKGKLTASCNQNYSVVSD
ncbi:2',3'-cyclic-nucleotide 2'-phosphodiesterase / 3'-nucleotidase [Gracilibacillus ureilyticus]|uniref:2',3'-cyclic-nucleotide 2'-phosphodiesterase / 3'-nucleotidase n=1 Tax=Gracilibacillus ureilyticus TaxID=531814 RepID=A0A1H9T0M5_9BACI|nr:bifunctional UDP-sugar hydrolase/5'-nucleotidase [Gracilibacillus ureilyticus]SER90289.1 2',3'-cyclic-nucleotide 2'-phosphodiesterase / 3'-nucleotidase [Gracilibacillus ureilyticus]